MQLGIFTQSVGDIWIVWLISTLALAVCLRSALSGISLERMLRFARDERGASYALPYVMTFPIYFLVVCVMIQSTMIVMVKMGTVYAAYAATRSVIVWQSGQSPVNDAEQWHQTVEQQAQQAAALAMTPFASGQPKHLKNMFPIAAINPSTILQSARYYETYVLLDKNNVARDTSKPAWFMVAPNQTAPIGYVMTKYRFAQAATSVALDTSQDAWNRDLSVTVNYEMPMLIPFAGRIVGTWWKTWRYFSRVVSSTVTLPSETPDSDHGIGIPYQSARLR